ncbi:MAG: DUF3842 family protein [Clostridia bacterium]|nr:DUF3842 family protein [Clostridia bacterium]
MDKLNILIIDGQGGRVGKLLCERIKETDLNCEITAVGTNSLATSAMLKGGATRVATGENSVLVCSKNADVIIGPVGIAIADSLLGEITSVMANAVAQSNAVKLLIPVTKCNNIVIGVDDLSFSELIDKTVQKLYNLYKN